MTITTNRHGSIPPTLRLTAGEVELPLTGVTITGRVDGIGVVWEVNQTFANTLDEAMEATYTFPLPNDAAVSGVEMLIGDRTIIADIKERGEARADYERAVAEGRSAALLEQDAGEVFRITVGNIHPGEAITIRTELHDQVTIDSGTAHVRFPQLVKPRYVPTDTPNAERLTPPRTSTPSETSVSFRLDSTEHLVDAICETHDTARVSGNSVIIEDTDLGRDVVIRWNAPATVTEAKWVPDPDDTTSGTVEVVVRVDSGPAADKRRKAVAVLLDRSGSMSGQIRSAARLASDVVDVLGPDDKVALLTFDSIIEPLTTSGGFEPADRRTKSDIKKALEKVDARGGTEFPEAISAVGALLETLDDSDEDFERVVVIITDGAYGDEATAAHQREVELAGARVIVVGIGQGLNGYLSTLTANGWFMAVTENHMTGEASSALCARVNSPAHRSAKIEADGLVDQSPNLAPDLYSGMTTTFWGRMPEPRDGARLVVRTESGELATVNIRRSDDTSARTRWAKARINSVDYDVMTDRVDSTAGRDEIIKVSTTFRVLSKYTAWIAVDRSRTTDTIIPVPVHVPSWTDDPNDLALTSSFHAVYSQELARPSLTMLARNLLRSGPSGPPSNSVWSLDPFDDDDGFHREPESLGRRFVFSAPDFGESANSWFSRLKRLIARMVRRAIRLARRRQG